MCNHLYERLVPVFDNNGHIDCADGELGCRLLDDADFVLSGYAMFAESYDPQPDGLHRQLVYLYRQPEQQPTYDDEIPF